VLRLAVSQESGSSSRALVATKNGGGGAGGNTDAADLDPLQARQARRLRMWEAQRSRRRGHQDGNSGSSSTDVYRPGATTGGRSGGGGDDDALMEEKRALWTMQRFRTARKTELVKKLLQKDMTTDATIWPSMGRAELIEVAVTNPFNHEERFKVRGVGEGNRGELRVITTTSEWRAFRAAAPAGGGWQNAAVGIDAAMMPLEDQLFDTQLEYVTFQNCFHCLPFILTPNPNPYRTLLCVTGLPSTRVKR
tara:strand:- start:135 stop:884 length:750 start_codon:yes stop_codon:yes gene_type:complete